jgi:hypothetical protein
LSRGSGKIKTKKSKVHSKFWKDELTFSNIQKQEREKILDTT